MTKRFCRSTLITLSICVSLASILFGLNGCAEFRKRTDGIFGDSSAGLRDEAVVRYNYKGASDEVFVEPPSVSPNIASAGESIVQTIRFAALSPDAHKRFMVTEIVTLSGKNILLELSRKSAERPQGSQISSIRFELPGGLARGAYKLISTISIGTAEKRQSAHFRVK